VGAGRDGPALSQKALHEIDLTLRSVQHGASRELRRRISRRRNRPTRSPATGIGAGSREIVEEYLANSLTTARRQGARLLELRAATTLARVLAKRDESQKAVDLLAPIYGWLTHPRASTPAFFEKQRRCSRRSMRSRLRS